MDQYDENRRKVLHDINLHLSTILGVIKLSSIKDSPDFANIEITRELIDSMQDAFDTRINKLEENKEKTQAITGYTTTPYNLLFNDTSIEGVKLEFCFPIVSHFTTDSLNEQFAKLIAPLNLPTVEEDDNSIEKISVSQLKSREYITIFPETDVNIDTAKEVISIFEGMAKDIMQNNKHSLPKDTIPSEVTLSFNKFESAKQKGLFLLGQTTSTSYSQPTSTSHYTSNSVAMSVPVTRPAKF